MATWEDGPEYAPAERPADFSVPAAAPLEVVAPAPQPAAGAPIERPAFDVPPAPVAELAELKPAVDDERDPAEPFDVVSSTATSMDSAWGAAHWSTPVQPSQTAPGPLPPAAPWPGPTDAAPGGPPPQAGWPTPTTPFPPPAGPAEPPGGFPPPGTPAWFGPGPPQGYQPPAAVQHDARAVLAAATPGLCICLAIGGLIGMLAPVLLSVAVFLATRVTVAQRQVRQVVAAGLGVLVFLAVLSLLGLGEADSLWWESVGNWAQLICWVVLVTVVLQVRAALRRRAGFAGARNSRWP